MRDTKNALTKTHANTFVALLTTFMVLTLLATNAGVDRGSDHNARVLQSTLGAIAGPLTGAIARGFQSCCLHVSLVLMVYWR